MPKLCIPAIGDCVTITIISTNRKTIAKVVKIDQIGDSWYLTFDSWIVMAAWRSSKKHWVLCRWEDLQEEHGKNHSAMDGKVVVIDDNVKLEITKNKIQKIKY